MFATAYLDNILVYSKTDKEYEIYIKKVLQALQQAELQLKIEKCKFYVQEIEFLGYIITPGRLQIDLAKVATVQEWPVPTMVSEVQAFLGFANYYKRKALSRRRAKICRNPTTNYTSHMI